MLAGATVVLVADDEIVKVHVHTNHPGQAFEKALTYGALSRMKIDNMREEHQEKLIKDAQKLAKQQRVDIAARGSKQRDKAHIRKTKSVPFTYQYGSYDLEVPYTEIKLSDTPGVGPNPPFHDYNTEGPKCDPKEGLKPLRLDWIRDRGDIEDYEGRRRNLEDDGKRAIKRGRATKEWRGRKHEPLRK